jgi:membrane associated rhomboid family serine protease
MRPPENWQKARVTLIIAAVTAIAWVLVAYFRLGNEAALGAGFIPLHVSGGGGEALTAALLKPLTATLVHAGAMHLVFNLLMHLFCGRSVETIIGGRQFVILYIAGAYAAAAAQFLVGPTDATPMVGASGAISAVIGAYSMMFGRNRVKVANPTIALWLNALWLAAAWVVLQIIVGFTFDTINAKIAVAAHIGGFLAGLLLAKPLLLLRYRGA